jgi:uncharacterized protein YqeY
MEGQGQVMETTRQKLDAVLKDAMRSSDEMRKQNVRMVLSAVKLSEVEKGQPMDEAGILSIIQKELKARQEALSEAQRANRPDLAERAKAEMSFLETFLPRQLSEDELSALAQEAIAEVGAKGPADMGKVMKAIMPKVQGRAPGDQVSQAVRKQLQS